MPSRASAAGLTGGCGGPSVSGHCVASSHKGMAPSSGVLSLCFSTVRWYRCRERWYASQRGGARALDFTDQSSPPSTSSPPAPQQKKLTDLSRGLGGSGVGAPKGAAVGLGWAAASPSLHQAKQRVPATSITKPLTVMQYRRAEAREAPPHLWGTAMEGRRPDGQPRARRAESGAGGAMVAGWVCGEP